MRAGHRTLHEVAAAHGVPPSLVTSRSRLKIAVRPRQEVCYRLYATGDWSLPMIGRLLKRDHTTILASIRVHARRNGLPLPDATPFYVKLARRASSAEAAP